MDWTLDLGNSRLKLREHDALAFAPGESWTAPCDADLPARLRERLRGSRARGAAFSSVAAPALHAAVLAVLREHADVVVTSCEGALANGSSVPATVGADRLFAALGALTLLAPEEPAAIVCDAGTALTVDRVERAVGPLRGTFRGGAIAPGPVLLVRALAEGGARLVAVRGLAPDVPALGRETEGALRSGVVHGFRGAARELVACLDAEVGGPPAPLYLTGGARGLLADVFDAARLRIEPELVHRGLLAALARRIEACSGSAS